MDHEVKERERENFIVLLQILSIAFLLINYYRCVTINCSCREYIFLNIINLNFREARHWSPDATDFSAFCPSSGWW